jgi:hypothetical protein
MDRRDQLWPTGRAVVEAFSQSPWMKARGLSGVAGLLEMVLHYSAFIDQLRIVGLAFVSNRSWGANPLAN